MDTRRPIPRNRQIVLFVWMKAQWVRMMSAFVRLFVGLGGRPDVKVLVKPFPEDTREEALLKRNLVISVAHQASMACNGRRY